MEFEQHNQRRRRGDRGEWADQADRAEQADRLEREAPGDPAQRRALVAQLVAARIAGDVATPRESNLGNIRRMSEREPRYLFGLEPSGRWSAADVLDLMARRCGVNPDAGHVAGPDTIDPELTVARLDDMGDRLRQAAERRERVLVATGHPTGLLAVHLELARALQEAGCVLLTPAEGWRYRTQVQDRAEEREIRYLGSVAMLRSGGALAHTHSAKPMRAMLAALHAAGEPLPDLVVADHGWAGAAGQAGIDTVGFADSNDPALFVGEAEGRIQVVVPLDDNVSPYLYAPLTTHLLQRARLRLHRPSDLLFPTSTTGH